MSIGTLEETTDVTALNTEIKLCDLKAVARDSLVHEDRKLLIPRWETCIFCEGYNPACPGYR